MYLRDYKTYPGSLPDSHYSDVRLFSWTDVLGMYAGIEPTVFPGPGTNGFYPAAIVHNICACPSYARLGGSFSWPISESSYGYNCWGCRSNDDEGLGSGCVDYVAESEVLVPSDTIALADDALCGDTDPSVLFYDAFELVPFNIPALLGLPPAPSEIIDALPTHAALTAMKKRHGGMWNVLFCDGHVECLTAKGLWYPRASVAIRWNRNHKRCGPPWPTFY